MRQGQGPKGQGRRGWGVREAVRENERTFVSRGSAKYELESGDNGGGRADDASSAVLDEIAAQAVDGGEAARMLLERTRR